MNIRLTGSKAEITAYIKLIRDELGIECKMYKNDRNDEYRTYFDISPHHTLEAIKRVNSKK